MDYLLLTKRTLPKFLLPSAAAFGAMVRPERADLVGVTSETVGVFKYKQLLSQLSADRESQNVLQGQVSKISKHALLKARLCERGSLGHAYASFMDSRMFEPSDRPPVRFLADGKSQLIAVRMREIHDILHVLFDCPTTLRGELTLKAIEFVQYGIPAHWASTYFASSRLNHEEQYFLATKLLPWAVRAGCTASRLLVIDYEEFFPEQIDHLRSAWGIQVVPKSFS
ncbi:Ubiquinone biosynthesis protein Coq4 [Ostreococcus tauri]|uniref:Ubiquinone biosynthesis protein COQ4 homolog, mitochondrial n=1 Tax=Ostreococcus tauri TaxID=70448 RepID=Q01EJ8_OSTTA|nr:Ubiquinone biosynthesis protein Coq4 [Ostreococcus tauri]CAL52255.2 Ubiquinone biosynthesis protein Coq4 [Ostreococcus tauri]|eukprot:XP_003074984.1 Ubiquinone biosynthesis protein Coq4 [Ostreococcus tauri]